MSDTTGQSILKSAQRLATAEKEYIEKPDPLWIEFLKRESSILLRRAFKFWWKIRFGR